MTSSFIQVATAFDVYPISECVNDTDFYTLEPLESVERELFFSYKDESDIKYGFNIISLLLLIKNSKKLSRYSMDLRLLKENHNQI